MAAIPFPDNRRFCQLVPNEADRQRRVYDVASEIYHADPVVEPSLSASIAHVPGRADAAPRLAAASPP